MLWRYRAMARLLLPAVPWRHLWAVKSADWWWRAISLNRVNGRYYGNGARPCDRASQPSYIDDYCPVPLSVTSSGLKVLPHVIVMTPEIAPVAVGVMFTNSVQLAWAGSVANQVGSIISAALTPENTVQELELAPGSTRAAGDPISYQSPCGVLQHLPAE